MSCEQIASNEGKRDGEHENPSLPGAGEPVSEGQAVLGTQPDDPKGGRRTERGPC